MKLVKTERILHELTTECKNPKPDRRRKDDWFCQPLFPTGLYCLVNETYEVEHGGKTLGSKVVQTFLKIGWMSARHGSVNCNADEEAFAALLTHTSPIEPDPRSLQHLMALHPDIEPQWLGDALAWLLKHGVVNQEQIQIAIAGVLQKWEEEEFETVEIKSGDEKSFSGPAIVRVRNN